MRTYSNLAGSKAKMLLNELIKKPISHDKYRHIMEQLGQELAKELIQQLYGFNQVLLICTNEDADFLARGVICSLERVNSLRTSLACFWNDRKRINENTEVAPIIRRYVEPIEGNVDAFVVVKSIISSACVVRSNISELIFEKNPKYVFILSPVILVGAQQRLEAEFDISIAQHFRYLWLAEDNETSENGSVNPGIGGSVYELLGIGTSEDKNRYTPNIVSERRTHIRRC
ncbi:MAG: hypothetical protein V9H25_02915 [Candidatus Competibacter sp.]|jgi:hypothetical protein